MNLPNKLTILRIIMIPICLALWALGQPLGAAIVFALAAITDFLDGYIARKQKIVTVFGKFADPVADKVLVLTAMIFLCADGRLPAWAVSLVAARELMVDGLRLVSAGKGNVIAAGWLGKIKTNLQFFCVLSAMLLPAAHWLTLTLAVLMSIMTVLSGVDYFWAARDVFKEDKP
ncbi:MAG: CDP-diacylglycerol--glycerol-3-phosphate 3-phosphatidyltransferase [Clostridiales bacterium]|nr:CDP-diacylglycerol--glycerol-3-phosphate 3-phosphatidyltransferase [Clostridiales bacterium]